MSRCSGKWRRRPQPLSFNFRSRALINYWISWSLQPDFQLNHQRTPQPNHHQHQHNKSISIINSNTNKHHNQTNTIPPQYNYAAKMGLGGKRVVSTSSTSIIIRIYLRALSLLISLFTVRVTPRATLSSINSLMRRIDLVQSKSLQMFLCSASNEALSTSSHGPHGISWSSWIS